MSTKKPQPDYSAIYASLKVSSQDTLSGLIILKRVKRATGCNTQDILRAAKMFECVKYPSGCIGHTTIFDFGITSENIAKSAKQDNLDIYIPQNQHLRGITTEG